MRAQDLGVKTVHAMIVEAAKAWEEKKARLECKIFTNSNGGRELGSYLKFTGSRTEVRILIFGVGCIRSNGLGVGTEGEIELLRSYRVGSCSRYGLSHTCTLWVLGQSWGSPERDTNPAF